MQKGFASIFILIFVLILAGLAGGYYLGQGQQKNIQTPAVTSTQEASPEKSQISGKPNNAKIIPAPTPIPTPDPTTGWKTFTNQKYKFSVKYPSNLLAQEENGYAYNLGISQGKAPDGSAYFHNFDIFIVPNTFNNSDTIGYDYLTSGWINGLYALKVGESKSLGTMIFKRLPDTQVAGQSALVVEVDPKTGNGPIQQRVFLKEDTYTFMFEKDYQSTDELIDFQNLLSTFKFLP